MTLRQADLALQLLDIGMALQWTAPIHGVNLLQSVASSWLCNAHLTEQQYAVQADPLHPQWTQGAQWQHLWRVQHLQQGSAQTWGLMEWEWLCPSQYASHCHAA